MRARVVAVAGAGSAAAKPERTGGITVGIDLAAVEAGSLVLVRKEIIGPRHLGKAFGRVRLTGIAIGVQFLRQRAICGFDVLLACGARYAEDGIGICHGT
jgi:hypothetical protein